MDWSQVSRSQWIVVGGTVAAVLGALFFDWYSFSVDFGPIHASKGFNAWDVNAIGKLAVLGALVMLAGAVLMFVPNAVQLPFPLPQALLVASAFTALMAILEFFDHHSHTSFGLWLTLIGGIVATYGAFEMGGRVAMPSGSSST